MDSRLAGLAAFGETRTYPKGHVLIEAGTKPELCYVILSGQVAGVRQTPSGEEIISFIMEPVSIMVEGLVLFDRVSPIAFKTLEESRLAGIRKEPLRQAVIDEPRLALELLEIASDKFFAALDDNARAKLHNVPQQLCELLADFAGHHGAPCGGQVKINHKVSIQLLTSMLGCNRASVVRAIKSLKEMGLLEYVNGYYHIPSIEKFHQHKEALGSL